MTETAEKFKQQLSQLSPQDRAELAYFLIHSLDEEAESEAEVAWNRELPQRMQSIDDGTAIGEAASQVISDLREKYA